MKDKYFYFFLIFIACLQCRTEAVNFSANDQLLSIHTDLQETSSKMKYFESDLSLVFDRIIEIEKNIKTIEASTKIQEAQKDTNNLQQEFLKLKTYVQETQKNINNKLMAAQQANKKLLEEITAVKKSLTAMLNYLEINESLLLENEKKVYVVESGDTLSIISKKLKVSIADLKTINKLNSDRIYVGQKLTLPSK